MHAYDDSFLFFKWDDFVFIIMMARFFEKGRFIHDLKERSAHDGYEEGKNEEDLEVKLKENWSGELLLGIKECNGC